MYGLINKAIQEFVASTYGQQKWATVREAAAVTVLNFDGMQQYPDEMSYALVNASAQELGETPEAFLEALGEYWIQYTGRQGYGELLRAAGPDLVSMLQNLDLLHARIVRSYPELQPPSFQCTDLQPGSLLLHYRSTRDGLAPMVIGLVKGLGKMFHTDVSIELVTAKASGADHDVFHVEYEPHD